MEWKKIARMRMEYGKIVFHTICSGFWPEDLVFGLEITSIIAEICGFWTKTFFFSKINIVFCVLCVITDIVCCSVPPDSASFVSVLQVKKGCVSLVQTVLDCIIVRGHYYRYIIWKWKSIPIIDNL